MGINLSNSLEETKAIASEFIERLEPLEFGATIVGLRGNLGSGKTTFTKASAEILGIKETVSSPTFVIEKIYKLENQKFTHLIHIDAYRLSSGSELLTLGWKEVSSDSKNIIFIEWPENIKDILPQNTLFIDFKFVDENKREIFYE